MRHSSGLRNRLRSGSSSTYRARRQANGADRYGAYQNGACTQLNIVGGRQFDPLQEAREHKDNQW